MNIGNAYRRARNALRFEKPHFAVTVQLDNVKAKNRQKNQSIRPKLYRLKFWYRILVPDFFQLIPANTNRSATLIENLANCKQSVYLERCGAMVKRRTRDR